jgi:hypothetical protein
MIVVAFRHGVDWRFARDCALAALSSENQQEDSKSPQTLSKVQSYSDI